MCIFIVKMQTDQKSPFLLQFPQKIPLPPHHSLVAENISFIFNLVI